MTLPANVGTGPGPITQDGCAVAFYSLLPPAGEAEIVHEAVAPAASVLELGCGTGRILRQLRALGHPVLGVDESPDMLEQAADLDTVCSSIEALQLQRTFDAVLLASTLINTPDQAARAAMLDAARRHTSDHGSLIVQWHPPKWFDTLAPFTAEREGIEYRIPSVDRDGPLLTATVHYQVEDQRWTHTFSAYRLSEDELATALRTAGFGHGRWLTPDRSWLIASVG
jgi:SAM-dependent methyltransferase